MFASFRICLALWIILLLVNSQEDDITVYTDYSPATKAFTQLQGIMMQHEQFKQRVQKNVSIEYNKCVNTINALKCNNIDQWQSVVEELKLENENSDAQEVPYLKQRKDTKVDLLKTLLNQTQYQNEVLADVSSKLIENQKKIMNYYYLLDNIYKIAKPNVNDGASFIQQDAVPAEATGGDVAAPTEGEASPAEEDESLSEQNAAAMLNADVPDLAKEQLGKAQGEYDLADESIQAQTASNMLKNYQKQTIQTLENLNKAFDNKYQDLFDKKQAIKSDIVKTRTLIQNEQNLKTKNDAKIAEMEAKIGACAGKPTNMEKDCEPLRVNASKIITEIDIIQARSFIINKELSAFIEDNSNVEQLKANEQEITGKVQEMKDQAEINYYLEDPQSSSYDPKPAQELQPIHHLKDNMAEKESQTQGKVESTGGEVPAGEEAVTAGETSVTDAPADQASSG